MSELVPPPGDAFIRPSGKSMCPKVIRDPAGSCTAPFRVGQDCVTPHLKLLICEQDCHQCHILMTQQPVSPAAVWLLSSVIPLLSSSPVWPAGASHSSPQTTPRGSPIPSAEKSAMCHLLHGPQVPNPLDSPVQFVLKCVHFSPPQSLRPLWHGTLHLSPTGHPDSLSLLALHSLPCSESDFEKHNSDHVTILFKNLQWSPRLSERGPKWACPHSPVRPAPTPFSILSWSSSAPPFPWPLSRLQCAASFLPQGLCTYPSLLLLSPHFTGQFPSFTKQL